MQSKVQKQYQFKLSESEYLRLSDALLTARELADDSATHATVNEFLQYLSDDSEDEDATAEEPDADASFYTEVEQVESAPDVPEDAEPTSKPRLGIFRKHSA